MGWASGVGKEWRGGPGWMGLLGLSDLLHRLGLVQPHQVDYQVILPGLDYQNYHKLKR